VIRASIPIDCTRPGNSLRNSLLWTFRTRMIFISPLWLVHRSHSASRSDQIRRRPRTRMKLRCQATASACIYNRTTDTMLCDDVTGPQWRPHSSRVMVPRHGRFQRDYRLSPRTHTHTHTHTRADHVRPLLLHAKKRRELVSRSPHQYSASVYTRSCRADVQLSVWKATLKKYLTVRSICDIAELPLDRGRVE